MPDLIAQGRGSKLVCHLEATACGLYDDQVREVFRGVNAAAPLKLTSWHLSSRRCSKFRGLTAAASLTQAVGSAIRVRVEPALVAIQFLNRWTLLSHSICGIRTTLRRAGECSDGAALWHRRVFGLGKMENLQQWGCLTPGRNMYLSP